jgi:hypothetical protein
VSGPEFPEGAARARDLTSRTDRVASTKETASAKFHESVSFAGDGREESRVSASVGRVVRKSNHSCVVRC